MGIYGYLGLGRVPGKVAVIRLAASDSSRKSIVARRDKIIRRPTIQVSAEASCKLFATAEANKFSLLELNSLQWSLGVPVVQWNHRVLITLFIILVASHLSG